MREIALHELDAPPHESLDYPAWERRQGGLIHKLKKIEIDSNMPWHLLSDFCYMRIDSDSVARAKIPPEWGVGTNTKEIRKMLNGELPPPKAPLARGIGADGRPLNARTDIERLPIVNVVIQHYNKRPAKEGSDYEAWRQRRDELFQFLRKFEKRHLVPIEFQIAPDIESMQKNIELIMRDGFLEANNRQS